MPMQVILSRYCWAPQDTMCEGLLANGALQTAGEYQQHVVLVDIGLPEMDGYEVARHLRRSAEVRGTKLIALTGYGQGADPSTFSRIRGLIITWLSL
jgi:CheY-like chemotaxis protein